MQCCINPKRTNRRQGGGREESCSNAHHFPTRFGFTLIEVLIGTALLAILVFGLSGLWVTINDQFLYLTLKQKAIFVVNGEMERLSTLYRITHFKNFSEHQQVKYNNPDDGDDFAGTDNPTGSAILNRLVFSKPSSNLNTQNIGTLVTDKAEEFDCPINLINAPETTQFNADCAGRILYDGNNAVTVNDDRNYVWIDQHRRITGRLSWQVRDINLNGNFPNANLPCWDIDSFPETNCQELIVYLHFPFRYSSIKEPDTDAGFGRLETLVLKTIVGRR